MALLKLFLFYFHFFSTEKKKVKKWVILLCKENMRGNLAPAE